MLPAICQLCGQLSAHSRNLTAIAAGVYAIAVVPVGIWALVLKSWVPLIVMGLTYILVEIAQLIWSPLKPMTDVQARRNRAFAWLFLVGFVGVVVLVAYLD